MLSSWMSDCARLRLRTDPFVSSCLSLPSSSLSASSSLSTEFFCSLSRISVKRGQDPGRKYSVEALSVPCKVEDGAVKTGRARDPRTSAPHRSAEQKQGRSPPLGFLHRARLTVLPTVTLLSIFMRYSSTVGMDWMESSSIGIQHDFHTINMGVSFDKLNRLWP